MVSQLKLRKVLRKGVGELGLPLRIRPILYAEMQRMVIIGNQV